MRRTQNSRRQRRATRRASGAADLFEGRFFEVLIIFVLALIVLGPEKLPRVVSELGRWVGRARAMARQFREQLEEEVQLEEARKAQPMSPAPPPSAAAPPPTAAAAPAAEVPPPDPAASALPPGPAAAPVPEPEPPRPKTFSHAHPTDETGADISVRTAASASADERRS
jgi:sec-independent protein translocase protein TatB